MYELFFEKLDEKITLTPDQQDIIKRYLIPKKIRKNQYLPGTLRLLKRAR